MSLTFCEALNRSNTPEEIIEGVYLMVDFLQDLKNNKFAEQCEEFTAEDAAELSSQLLAQLGFAGPTKGLKKDKSDPVIIKVRVTDPAVSHAGTASVSGLPTSYCRGS